MNHCFFASNFPVENNIGWDVNRLLGAYEKISKIYDKEDMKKLFSVNAMSAYNLKNTLN
jgi:predicted TIM-barrel fold metal-dependent hydrolase